MKSTNSPKTPSWLSSRLKSAAVVAGISAAGLLCQISAKAGQVTWNFDTDPTVGANALQVTQTGFTGTNGNSVYWLPYGGNPGGFLGLTWSTGSSASVILFPDIDSGKLVTAFQLDTDLRVGNPRENVRAADGFSVNFARSNDAVWGNPTPSAFAASGQPENGTATGIAISFDTWSGNTLPDGNDIEGIIVRVDNKTILEHGLPTRNGACNDPTSPQTGPQDAAYWAANPTSDPSWPAALFAPAAFSGLCWEHLTVTLDTNSQLTVTWKGSNILDHFQTTFFPSAGGIVLAGRTGGADEMTHFDNMTLKTTAIAADTIPPTDPSGIAAVGPPGAGRIALTWNASTDNSGRVAYELSRNGTILSATLVTNYYVDTVPFGGTAYTYTVRALDVSLNYSGYATNVITSAAETQVTGTVKCQIYDNISGTGVDLLTNDVSFPSNPTRAYYNLGLSIGSQSGLGGWNNSFGDSYGLMATGVLIPAVSGNYDFFIRSDDSSQVFLNTSGATLPDVNVATPIAAEGGCCHAFLEPNDVNNTGMTTSNQIALVAGQSYGFVVLLKEGGGGDGVAVGMRIAGDTTPAANVPPISGLLVKGSADTVGSTLTINTQPAPVSVIANEATSFSVSASEFSYYDNTNFNTGLWYQWTKNGVQIPGATSSSYSIPVAALADNAAQFAVVVGAEGLVKTSSVATLTVTADNKPPTIKSVSQVDDGFKTVNVVFSEPVTSPTATTAGNYTLSSGATVSAAVLSADHFSVTLTTSALLVGTNYTLTVNNVADNAGNPIAANTKVQFGAWAIVPNAAKVDQWKNISGTAVTALTADPRFPATPDVSWYSSTGLLVGSPNGNAGFNDSFGDNYGIRVTGWLIPAVSGSYYFFIRSDDSSELHVNTTGSSFPDPLNDTPLAQETGCCHAFLEPTDAANNGMTSTNPVALVAGTQYGYTVLLKEGGGGDGVAVAWRLTTDNTAAGTLAPISSQAYYYGPQVVANPTLSFKVNTDGTVTLTFAGSLYSSATANGTYTKVTGAVSPYTITPKTSATPANFYRSGP